VKIAITRREYITHLDGVNRFIANLAEGLIKLGNTVKVVTWSFYGTEKDDIGKFFKDAHMLEEEVEVISLNRAEMKLNWTKIAFDWFTKGSEILKDFDAVVINGIVPIRFKKTKVAVNHGFTFEANKFYTLVAKRLYKKCDRVVCVSKRLSKEFQEFSGIEPEVIPLPLKLKNFKVKKDREDVIVHIGTRDVKNVDISVKTVEILRNLGHNFRLVVIGARTSHVLNASAGKDFVDLKFNLSEKEKIEILSSSKALILPSSYETFSYAVLEALACGTPAIVSEAIPDEVVINGFNGFRVRSFNPDDYAKALLKIFENDEWYRISKNAVEFSKQFDHIEIAKRYLSLISTSGSSS